MQTKIDTGSGRRDGIKELDGFCRSVVLQMEKMDSRQIREYCYKSLRKTVMYFHMDTPPLFKIYQLSDQDQEKFSKILKEDITDAGVLPAKDNSESFTYFDQRKGENYIDVKLQQKICLLREIADKPECKLWLSVHGIYKDIWREL